jgi:Rrf2 family nitric oxide-sensitive transcriptional repressor
MSTVEMHPIQRHAMRVTLNTDYSLRVLMFVATKAGLSTIQEIAESFEISRAHLMKVVHQLGLLGYIETVRGKNGGIRLLRPPADVAIGAVVRDTEEELAVLGCLEGPGYCRIERACILRRAFREATAAFLGVLDGYTLEDLVKPRTALAGLLGIPAPAAGRARA